MSDRFKKARAALASGKVTPRRVGVPQVDPGDDHVELPPATSTASSTAPADETARPDGITAASTEIPPMPSQQSGADTKTMTTAERLDPRLMPVNMSVKVQPFGMHAYPDRAAQVRYEAFMRDIKPWQVVEEALADYFERRYGKKPQ